ncbi:hypothetical protein KIM372_16520 [Bombiscardovia nodaiensis]|uniref:Thymidylate kinase n=1 Tax=Bombiscardovia nodaiensis TaxID=2932181 RepID=A0ABM8BAA1_9BIFI|nr:hypothetical protein KIM372_16520 [Bombiscardovia nodaiensis]
MSSGLFISFEGVDGAGKTTQAQRAHDFLQTKGMRSLVTREPGGTPAGLAIRELVLHGMAAFPSIAVTGGTDVVDASDDLNARTEALLYAADRAEHVAQVIEPALERGDIVLCDRYSDSSIAYQSGGRKLDQGEVSELSRWAAQGLKPARTYLLDVDPLQSHDRVNDEPDRMEAEGDDFQSQVRDAFLLLAQQEPERFVIVDASRPIEEVWQTIQADLETLTADMPVNIAPVPDDEELADSSVEDESDDDLYDDESDDESDDEAADDGSDDDDADEDTDEDDADAGLDDDMDDAESDDILDDNVNEEDGGLTSESSADAAASQLGQGQ